MVDSLSKRLNLRVNNYQIILDDNLNETELRQHNIKKVGFLSRLIIFRNQVVFSSINCELKYLDDNFENLVKSNLNFKSPPDVMCGTSAYLFFKKGVLSEFRFQIISSKLMANIYVGEFWKKIVELIGPCTSSYEIFRIWEIGNQRLILEYPSDKKPNGCIYLILNEQVKAAPAQTKMLTERQKNEVRQAMRRCDLILSKIKRRGMQKMKGLNVKPLSEIEREAIRAEDQISDAEVEDFLGG